MEDKIVYWGDKKLVLHDFKKSHANGGRLGKFWVEDVNSGRQFLIKGSGPMSWEPFSEKIAYIIGKNIGIDVLEYDIIPASVFKGVIELNPLCKYISICEKIDRKNFSITSVAEIKRARNVVKNDDDPIITNRQVMYELLDKKYIDTMILFDAIIGNEDRHYGNVHILRSKDGDMIGAPLLDNGASLLARTPLCLSFLLGNKVGKYINSACTVERNHDKQASYISDISGISFDIIPKTIEILNEIQPVLDLMPKYRAIAIKRYLVYRLHKYLGMLKKDTGIKDRNTSINMYVSGKEKEHT